MLKFKNAHMTRTWLSLFYETGYLLVAGVFLLAAPDTAFKLLFSNNSYGDVLPRLFGTVLFSIGVIFVQIVRLHIEELYTTAIVVRVPLMAVNLCALLLFGQSTLLDAVRNRYPWRSPDGSGVRVRPEKQDQ